MQCKDVNLDIHSKIVKNMGLCTFEDSLISDKSDIGKTKNEEVLSHVMDQEVMVEEVGRILDDRTQVGKTSSRQNKATITRSKDFLW
jgi:hypothetical protein